MRYRALIPLFCLTMLLASCKRSAEQAVTIATSPEVAATGIVDTFASSFHAQRQLATRIIVTEDRFIPSLVAKDHVDVVITTSPAVRNELQRKGQIHLANTFALEQYVIAGPRNDPARVRDATSPGDALRRIARRDRTFCSPVDVPDLREVEARVWSTSRADPSDDRRYRHCDGTAAEVLKESSRRSAYTITDRGTFEALGNEIELEPLLRGEPPLVEAYTVVLVAEPRRTRNALWFVEWVMSARVRDLIAAHRFEGERRLLVRGEW